MLPGDRQLRREIRGINTGAGGIVRVVQPCDGGALEDFAWQALKFQTIAPTALQHHRMVFAANEQDT